MIDLHIHTNYSDGTYDLKRTLEEAEKANVNVISITDHDTVEAHKELKQLDPSEYYTGKIIVGAEFNTTYKKYKFELLGYDFDIDTIDEWVKEKYVKNEELDLNKEFEILLDGCKRNGIKTDDNLAYNRAMGWPVDIVYQSVTKFPENKKFFSDREWESSNAFFRAATCREEFPLYIDFSFLYPSAYEVSEKIRSAGGKVFIAHLFFYPIDDHMRIFGRAKKRKNN